MNRDFFNVLGSITKDIEYTTCVFGDFNFPNTTELINAVNEERKSSSHPTDLHTVGGSRGSNKANLNVVRQITKFGMIVFCKIVINI